MIDKIKAPIKQNNLHPTKFLQTLNILLNIFPHHYNICIKNILEIFISNFTY